MNEFLVTATMTVVAANEDDAQEKVDAGLGTVNGIVSEVDYEVEQLTFVEVEDLI